jgi:hypothetical protein
LSVILHDVLVPSVIQNGSVPFVVLDCHYSMNHSEKDGMILKWYVEYIYIIFPRSYVLKFRAIFLSHKIAQENGMTTPHVLSSRSVAFRHFNCQR